MKKTLLTIAATAVMATSALAESNMGWKTNTDIDEMEGTKTHFHFARSYDIKGSFVIRYPDNYQDVRDVDIFYSSGDNYICTSLDGKLEVPGYHQHLVAGDTVLAAPGAGELHAVHLIS